jgi:ribonuclease HI
MVLRFYTDGACSGNGKEDACGGWGVVACLPKKQIKISGGEKSTTNNRMELTAVIKALSWYLKHDDLKPTVNKIEIYSDSSYVVNAVNQNWLNFWKNNGFINSKGEEVKNKDLWLKFIKITTHIKDTWCEVEFIKVKGHSGVALNVVADKLAVKAIDRIKG